MDGSKSLVDRRPPLASAALLVVGGLVAGALVTNAARASPDPAELNGASPGERAAIIAYCGDTRGVIARGMCISNQVTSLLRLGREPDLSVASPARRGDILADCAGKAIPAARFACERDGLRAARLPVRDAPGAGPLGGGGMPPGGAPPGSLAPHLPQEPDFPFFDIEQWRRDRPPMRAARGGPALSPAELYEKIAPSVYVVIASAHAIALLERTPHAQGSAVAITDHILVTNCHVLTGRPQVSLSQQGQTDRATLIYADPGGDRCFLKTESMILHPVQGVRRFDDLHVGEAVFSVGTPIGLERSYGEGIISGLRQFEGVNMVQNSAPSWFGSSGGGLFDTRGNLVGITTASSATVANLNFAIAAEDFWF